MKKWITDLFASLKTFFKWVLVAGVILAGVFMIHRHFKTHPEQLERIGTAFDQFEKKVGDRLERDPATAPADPKAQEELERVSKELATVTQVLDDLKKMPRGVDPKVEKFFKEKIAELEKATKELKDKVPVVDPRIAELERVISELKNKAPVVDPKAQEALVKLDEEKRAREDLARDMAKKMDAIEKSLAKTQGDLVEGQKATLAAIKHLAESKPIAPVSATVVTRGGRSHYAADPDVAFVTSLRRLANVQTFADLRAYRDKKFAEIDRGLGDEETKEIKRKAVIKQIAKLTEERVKIAQESAARLRDQLAIDEVQRGFAEDVYTALRMGR